MVCAYTPDEWREIATWLDKHDAIPLPLAKLRYVARFVVGRGLYDDLLPILGADYE